MADTLSHSSTVARGKIAKRNEDLVIAENALQMERIVSVGRIALMIFIAMSGFFANRVFEHVARPPADPLRGVVMGTYLIFALVLLLVLRRMVKPNRVHAFKAELIVAIVDFSFVIFMHMRAAQQGMERTSAELAAVNAVLMCFALGRVSSAHIIVSWAAACASYAVGAAYIGQWTNLSGLFVLACYSALAFLLIKMQGRIRDMFVDLRRRDNLTRFLPAQVADEVIKYGDASLQPVQREVTVLFSDIRDFTSFSESLPPGAVLAFLDEYFGHMSHLVKEHEGIVNKFLGDGMLAFWGVPQRNARHAELAVKAALDMRKVVEELNQVRRNNGAQPFRIGIGIHTGPVAAGMLGGSDQHEYTVIGDAVNVASRVEGLTKHLGVDILVSESTWRLLDGKFSGQRLEEQRVKGRQEGVVVYAVQDRQAKVTAA